MPLLWWYWDRDTGPTHPMPHPRTDSGCKRSLLPVHRRLTHSPYRFETTRELPPNRIYRSHVACTENSHATRARVRYFPRSFRSGTAGTISGQSQTPHIGVFHRRDLTPRALLLPRARGVIAATITPALRGCSSVSKLTKRTYGGSAL